MEEDKPEMERVPTLACQERVLLSLFGAAMFVEFCFCFLITCDPAMTSAVSALTEIPFRVTASSRGLACRLK